MQFLSAACVPHVESFIDGIDHAVDESNWHALDQTENSFPVLAYFSSRSDADEFAQTLQTSFHVDCKISHLDEKSLVSAWDDPSHGTDHELSALLKKFRLKINSTDKAAFGTGAHATTLASLKAIDTLDLSDVDHHLDLGTGSGILTLAIQRKKSVKSVATDLSEAILSAAKLNAQENNLEHVDWVMTTAVPSNGQTYDLITANIPAPVLLELCESIANNLAPGGLLILAGFPAKETSLVVEKYFRYDIKLVWKTDARGWPALALRKLEKQ